MAGPYSDKETVITRSEHISPAKTGDNIEAKRAANYIWDTNSSTWIRQTAAAAGGGDASAANQTSGAQKTQIYDPTNQTTLNITDDGYAKVSSKLEAGTVPTTADSSGNFNFGTLTGLLPYPQLIGAAYSGFGNALKFDGVDRGSTVNNQAVDCGVTVGMSGIFTLEAKLFKTRNTTEVIAGKFGETLSTQNFALYFSAGALIAGVTDSGNTFRTAASGVLANGKHDVAMDYDGTNLRVYVDGAVQAATAVAALAAPDSVTSFTIGRSSQTTGNGYPFAGAIDCIRLSSTARYAGAYTPATTPFATDANTVGLWHFDEMIGPVTAVNLSDKNEDAPHTSGDIGNFILGVRNDDAATDLAGTNADYSPVAVDSKGAAFVNIKGLITKATVTATASGATTIVTPSGSQKVRLFKFSYSSDGNNASTGTTVALSFGSNAAIDKQFLLNAQPYADGLTNRYVEGAVGEALKVTLGATVSTGIYINVAYQLI